MFCKSCRAGMTIPMQDFKFQLRLFHNLQQCEALQSNARPQSGRRDIKKFDIA